MPRSRPASNPLSFHKHTGQYYVTREGKRVYLGADQDEALSKYHRLALGMSMPEARIRTESITLKEIVNRFLSAQQANWQNSGETQRCYKAWLEPFLVDHPGMRAEEYTVEMFAAWKILLRKRKFLPRTINHYLGAVKAVFRFAEDTGLIEVMPKLRRVKNEPCNKHNTNQKPLFTAKHIQTLLQAACMQVRTMILLALNCGFGPKDIHDLTWNDIEGERVTLPRSKTGVCQTFLLWPETKAAIDKLREARAKLIQRLAVRNRPRTDNGRIFVTKYWRPWSKDAVTHAFKKLCDETKIPRLGFYRLRHCASTAVSLVANPHVQRKFMRHSQLQQQVTYTHTPDEEVDLAISKAREKLLGKTTEGSEKDQAQPANGENASGGQPDQTDNAGKENPGDLAA